MVFAAPTQPLILTRESTYYDVEFTLPEYAFDTIDAGECGTFTSIDILADRNSSVDDYLDYLDTPGLPTLPFFYILYGLPDDAYNLRLVVLSSHTVTISVDYPIEPADVGFYFSSTQPDQEDCFDASFYSNGYGWKNRNELASYLINSYDSVTAQFYTEHFVLSSYQFRGVPNMSLSINPFLYSPLDAELKVLTHAYIRVELYADASYTDIVDAKVCPADKVVHDGKIFIHKNGHIYDVLGQIVE